MKNALLTLPLIILYNPINYPAAETAGYEGSHDAKCLVIFTSLPQSQGFHIVFPILFPLISDVVLNNLPGTLLSDSGGVIVIGPKLSSPQVLLYLGKFQKNLSGSDAFE